MKLKDVPAGTVVKRDGDVALVVDVNNKNDRWAYATNKGAARIVVLLEVRHPTHSDLNAPFCAKYWANTEEVEIYELT